MSLNAQRRAGRFNRRNFPVLFGIRRLFLVNTGLSRAIPGLSRRLLGIDRALIAIYWLSLDVDRALTVQTLDKPRPVSR
jgi:hypothetical protein